MSNYPDDFKGTNMDARPEEEFPIEVKEIENAQLAYREIIEATIVILKKRGLTHYARQPVNYSEAIDRLSFMGVAEFLKQSVASEIKVLENAGYDYCIEGDDHSRFFDRMYTLLKSDLRANATRNIAPQNPTTTGDL